MLTDEQRAALDGMLDMRPRNYAAGIEAAFLLGLRMGAEQMREAAAKACDDECLTEPQDESDYGYQRGINHCIAAIRALPLPGSDA